MRDSQADSELDEAKARSRATFNAAAGHFDAAPMAFWDRFGSRTVDLAALRPGQRVLDVCCGTGASALPAAAAVGPSGEVIGVDLAEELLALARAKAAQRGYAHARFESGDMTALGFADGSFDAVICVFGVFFVPDMAAAVAELWRVVRPGGTLAVTTWGGSVFEPGAPIFWETVGRRRPDLVKVPPWQRITTPDALREMLSEAGLPRECVEVTAAPDRQVLAEPGDLWTVVLGTGYRAVVDALPAADAQWLREECVAEMTARGATALHSEALYAIARKEA